MRIPAAVIERILRHLGLTNEIPEPCAARAPPLPLDTDASASDVPALDPRS